MSNQATAMTAGGRILWSKIAIAIAAGKAFVAGAGLGLAALGVVDLAGSLGIRPLMDIIRHEHVFDVFAYGGGAISFACHAIWSIVSR